MACETYDDGSYFCEFAGGYWERGDAYGNITYGSYVDDEGIPFDPNQAIVTIGDALQSIFGGGQRGQYSPNRNQQYPYSYPGPGPYYPNQQAVGINAGVNRGGVGGSLNVSTNTLLLAGGAVLLFILGTKRGR